MVLSSDEMRKQRAGLDPVTPASAAYGEGLYAPDTTTATYTEILDRARVCLSNGESVVLDASWHDPRWREAASRMAGEVAAELDEFHCVAPLDLLETRIVARAARCGDASDATVEVARRLATTETPWPTASVIDAALPPDAVLKSALDRLDCSRQR